MLFYVRKDKKFRGDLEEFKHRKQKIADCHIKEKS